MPIPLVLVLVVLAILVLAVFFQEFTAVRRVYRGRRPEGEAPTRRRRSDERSDP